LRETAPAVICDPWAGMGELLSFLRAITGAPECVAFTPNETEFKLGRILLPESEWKLGSPLALLNSINPIPNLVVSILPFGARSDKPLTLIGTDGNPVELRDDLGNLILTSAASRMEENGTGLFVVPQSFFISKRSVLSQFSALGLGVEAALALPPGTFAPYTNIATYLLVIRKRQAPRMFVAQLSSDANTNARIIQNLKECREEGRLELGRFVDPLSFNGLEAIRLEERLNDARRRFDAPMVRLEDLATAITLGRYGSDFAFAQQPNSIFVPLIGSSDVVESVEDLTLKQQNYAQVVIDPAQSNVRFVARFLNSELGKEIRETNKSGFIPKLNKQTLKGISIFVPDLATQKAMMETEVRISTEQNTLLGLQNELGALQRELWSNPRSASNVNERIVSLSGRLSGGLKQQAADSLDNWFETLPFPLASICRAWQATPGQDYKAKHEHLLHFFEATAEFVSVVLLSAFSSNESLFAPHRQKIADEMTKQHLSFTRATFGTWKLVVEYLAKQTRQLLSGDKDSRALCAEIFCDPSLELPQALGRKELATILAAANKMRNDWGGHGGVVGQDEAQLRNEQLLAEVQKLREVFVETWQQAQLIHPLNCRPRRGAFENEITLLKGSNSEFLKETRSMGTWLDVERLYLCSGNAGYALKLLPLIQVGPSPQSARNACYFFNRLERDGGARFISYHYIDKPELTGTFDQAMEAIKLLTEV
jgi:hypothetical protein